MRSSSSSVTGRAGACRARRRTGGRAPRPARPRRDTPTRERHRQQHAAGAPPAGTFRPRCSGRSRSGRARGRTRCVPPCRAVGAEHAACPRGSDPRTRRQSPARRAAARCAGSSSQVRSGWSARSAWRPADAGQRVADRHDRRAGTREVASPPTSGWMRRWAPAGARCRRRSRKVLGSGTAGSLRCARARRGRRTQRIALALVLAHAGSTSGRRRRSRTGTA